MKSSAILINTARGSIVNPDALYRALSSGQIARAALDVTEPEPIPMNSPLLRLENLIITPTLAAPVCKPAKNGNNGDRKFGRWTNREISAILR